MVTDPIRANGMLLSKRPELLQGLAGLMTLNDIFKDQRCHLKAMCQKPLIRPERQTIPTKHEPRQ